MLCGFGLGSKGSSVQSYTLRLPFTISPDRNISVSTESTLRIDHYEAKIHQNEDSYALEVYGLRSEEEALRLLPRICAGLIWTSLHESLGIRFDPHPSTIHYYDPPVPVSEGSSFHQITSRRGWKEVDGHYNSDQTIIKPEYKRVIRLWVGRPDIYLGLKDQQIALRISEALDFRTTSSVLDDKKLWMAFEMYSNSYFEISLNARFLTIFIYLL